jgi:hypothetical protein
MRNSHKLNTLLFFLLFYMIGIFFLRSYYLKKINQQELYTIKLSETLKSNDNILTDLHILNQDLESIECIIDSIVINDLNKIDKIEVKKKYDELKKKTKKTFTITDEKKIGIVKNKNTLQPSIDVTKINNDPVVTDKTDSDDTLAIEKIEVSIDGKVKKAKKTKKEVKRSNRRYLFEGINRVYNRKKNHKPLTSKEKFIWIEMHSKHGQFLNSMQNIIKEIIINNIHVRLSSVKEYYLGNGTTAYMLGVKVPRKLLLKGRNLIIVKDEQNVHYKWILID